MSAYGNVACVQTQLSWKCGSKVIIFIVSRFFHQILRAILRSFFDLCGASAFSIYKTEFSFLAHRYQLTVTVISYQTDSYLTAISQTICNRFY